MNTRLRIIGSAVAAGALLLTAAPASAGQADMQSLHGTFSETSTGTGLGYDIHGSAKMTITDDGTVVAVNISGLDPDKHYSSHLHNAPCGVNGGGGHYQNASGQGTTPPNELWLSSTDDPQGGLHPNPGGVAHASGSATWIARTSGSGTLASSVVVHEPGGARITCADLT